MFKKNYIDLLMQEELKRFVKANGVNAIKQTNTKDFVDGNIVVKVPLNRKSITDLLNGSRSIHIEDDKNDYLKIAFTYYHDSSSSYISRLSYRHLFKDTTNRIIKIDTQMSFEEALNFTIKFRNKLGTKFYGCLFKVVGMENTLINPFHILTALSSVSEYGKNKQGVMDVTKHKFCPIIYFMEREEKLDILYHSIFADMKKVDDNINCLMHVFGSKKQTKTKITNTNIENLTEESLIKIKNGTMNIEIKYKETLDSGSAEEEDSNSGSNYVIAHQLMADGVVAPFYGASLVKISKDLSDSKGTRLTPMPTVNIAGAMSNFEEVVFDNVCTGNTHRNTTMSGLRTQTHVYYGSPYGSSKNFMPGSLMYSRRMIERSLQVYRTVGLFNFEEPEDVAIDYEELKKKTIEFSKEHINSDNGLVEKKESSKVFNDF